jgi:hypothetical protein
MSNLLVSRIRKNLVLGLMGVLFVASTLQASGEGTTPDTFYWKAVKSLYLVGDFQDAGAQVESGLQTYPDDPKLQRLKQILVIDASLGEMGLALTDKADEDKGKRSSKRNAARALQARVASLVRRAHLQDTQRTLDRQVMGTLVQRQEMLNEKVLGLSEGLEGVRQEISAFQAHQGGVEVDLRDIARQIRKEGQDREKRWWIGTVGAIAALAGLAVLIKRRGRKHDEAIRQVPEASIT